ncbi:ABC transporter substrate-binding protein [Amycolatopsis sp. NPDC004079]|uniref:ABC transporter substrate-binding protein n=1 Tax=Amycolatopsis sp. NPDC004079 TaxID=3154549 RepID=UPI0033B649D8
MPHPVRSKILAGASVLTLAACSAGGSTRGADDAARDRGGAGGTLSVAINSATVPIPDSPATQGAEGIRWVSGQIYDALTAFDLDQADTAPTPHPSLAASWTVSPDKRTWTFRLKTGVKFHDGTAFDSSAVLFELDRLTKPGSPFFSESLSTAAKFQTQTIASYRAPDPATVEITTRQPDSLLLWDLAGIYFPSPAAVREYGNRDYPGHATGTGPFKVRSYTQDTLDLVANKDYWQGPPKLDGLRIRAMADPSSRLAALEAGDVNWIETPPPDSVPRLKSQGDAIRTHPYPHTMVLYLNLAKAPFTDPKVREALQYAIDRKSLCSGLLDGLCLPASQAAYEGNPWYDKSLGEKYHYDPAKAKALLREAGHSSGLSIKVAIPTGGSGTMWPQPMTQVLQANLKDAGIDMQLVPLESNLLLTIGRAGFTGPNQQYDALYNSMSWAAPFLADRFSSDRVPPGGCCNVMGYRNPAVDRAFAAVSAEFDPARQAALMAKALGLAAADSPMTFVVHDLDLQALAPSVRGFVQPQSWYFDVRNVWVKPA